MAEGRGRGAYAALSAAATAGLAGAVVAYPGSQVGLALLTNVPAIAAALFTAVRWLGAARWASGRARLGLYLLGIAAAAWAVGGVLWLAHYLGHPRGDAPIPPVANVAFAVTMLSAPTAVALLFGHRRSASVRTVLDALLIATGLLYLAWAAVLGPLYRAHGGGPGGLGQLTYPLADVIIASMALILAREAVPAMRVTAELSATAMIVMGVTDSAYTYQVANGTYRPGSLSDLGWFLSFMLAGIAAPRRRELSGAAALADRHSIRLLLPYLPFGLALITGLVLFAREHGRVEPLLYLLSMALTALVVLRQLLTLHDNRRLTRQLEGAVENLRHRAYHDPLTGLANRDMFLEAVERALAGPPDAQVAVLYIDLDGFKPVNDTLGHAAGDRVLTEVAGRLSRSARVRDLVGRLGGDEFAVLLTGLWDAADAQAAARRIHSALAPGITVDGEDVRVGASVGVAYGRAGRIGLGELIRNADLAMYTAKLQGRGRTVTFDPSLLAARPLDRTS